MDLVKKFYVTFGWLKENKIPESEYEDKLYPGFVHYAMKYAAQHKDKKFVIEGVWLFKGKWFTPDEFKDYAFYIKGTSVLISNIRAYKRDSYDSKTLKDKLVSAQLFAYRFSTGWKWRNIDEQHIKKYRNYFNKLIEQQKRDEKKNNYKKENNNKLIKESMNKQPYKGKVYFALYPMDLKQKVVVRKNATTLYTNFDKLKNMIDRHNQNTAAFSQRITKYAIGDSGSFIASGPEINQSISVKGFKKPLSMFTIKNV